MHWGLLPMFLVISGLISPAVVPRLTPGEPPGIRWTWEPLYERHLAEARRLGLNLDLIQGKGEPEAVAREQLKAAKLELARPRAWPPEEFRTGVARTVVHLSPPESPPRAVVVLRGSGTCPCPFYLLEQRTDGWAQTDLGVAEATAILDVSGDGRPEIINSASFGSGHFLSVRVWAWDQHRLWEAFSFEGPGDSGPFGFDHDAETGTRVLWVDLPAGRGLFTELAPTHGPFLKERRFYRWAGGTYRQERSYPLATPFYHLNQYLSFAGKGDWESAARHAEPGARVDRRLAASLGRGPLHGGGLRDAAFVNERQYFRKGEASYYVDFGPTGRVLRLGEGTPGRREEIGRRS